MNKANIDSKSNNSVNFKANNGRSYSYWRLRILYSTILGYSSFYLVRLNLSVALPGIQEEFGYSLTQSGTILSLHALIYGLGKFFNGYLSDKSNARYFMAFGLFLSGMISIFIGFSHGIISLGLLWMTNGWTQSMGWPPSARLLTHWFSPKELGTKWSIWSCSHQLGSAVTVSLCGVLIAYYSWRFAFIVPGIIALVGSLFLLNRLRDSPKSVGLPVVELYKNDEYDVTINPSRITFTDIKNLVLKNKFVWYICLANIFLYIPRMGIMYWGPSILKNLKGADIILASSQTAVFDLAGIPGAIFAGWVSDKIFKGRRGPVGSLYLFFLAIALFVLLKIPYNCPWTITVTLAFVGFLMAGPQVLAGIALADFASKRAVGVATGFSGLLTYIVGSVVSGIGFGAIVERWGWDAGFMVFITSALIAMVFFAMTWHVSGKKHQ